MADGFKERYDEHMVGRNGADALSRTCLVVALVLVVLSLATVGVSPFLYVLVLLLGIAAAVYAAFRMNSRNVIRRQLENDAFVSRVPFLSTSGERGESASGRRGGQMGKQDRARRGGERPRAASARPKRAGSTRPRREAQDEREAHAEQAARAEQEASVEKITVACEECGQRLSVPTGKGNIKITCPRCSNSFTMFT